jgi:signal transduction histidine kinase
VSGDDPRLEIDFRFYPFGNIGSKADMRWVHCRLGKLIYEGKVSLLLSMMDLTKAKEVESLLKVQDKMTSLGRVASGIAHEIRNPLSGINIYLDNLEKLYGEGEDLHKVKKIFEQLRSASKKIETVVKGVVDFSKPAEPKFVLTDIHQPVNEALKLCSVMMRKSGIELEKALSESLPPCRVDPQLIEGVILNLMTNAIEAMRDIDGPKKIMITSSMGNGRIFLRISDSGPGVSPKDRDKIFDPFFTTKNESMGIGLSLCQRVILDHGGSLSVSTSQWGGAEFVIEIPIEKGLGDK